ncbi:calcium/sodium antiporter [Plebeiibacterium marinum]|uniref:Calcium/sodium antiporter n=1 Tax=Plebeiibacterium marinum TaxID=2992111 RepID=A0AAE3MDF1_9BACT|nr:calcium/sodium antiporter [Plebeiobacterium marinum]MCW3804977.1 calcium/sodium antiporter [Plebeiobacterium marinum]
MGFLMLIAGFVLLFFSGDWLVKSSVQIARYLKISTLVVGITVVAFGTSAPELIVSLKAVFDGVPDISVGNVVGSNIANIALVLGTVSVILPITVKKKSILFDWSIMMMASILFYVFSLNYQLQFHEGVIFLTFLVLYLVFSVYHSRKQMGKSGEVIEKPSMKFRLAIGLLVLAAVGLYLGSELLVRGAVIVAKGFNVSERVIGISVVAFGTSVPELATSVMAAIKKETDISIGNIIGSNIFNLLGILGVTSALKTINISSFMVSVDMIWMMGISVLLVLAMLPIKHGHINRFKGAIFVSAYLLYMVLLFTK